MGKGMFMEERGWIDGREGTVPEECGALHIRTQIYKLPLKHLDMNLLGSKD